MITQIVLQAKLPVQENGPTINLLMTRIDPTVLECSQEALSLKDIRGDLAVSTSLHQDHLGASPLSLGGCLGYLLIYFFDQRQTTRHSLSLGTGNTKANQGDEME